MDGGETKSLAMNHVITTPPLDEGRFLPGTILNQRYRIVARLGKGGMGEVFRANDLHLGVPVALKFLLDAHGGDSAAVARLRQEVRLARQVTHPNVCRVFDFGETGGLHFLSMEYVDGEDLGSLLRRIGRLPQAKAIDLACQLCAGVAAAHSRGVLHRDLKPANVMVDGRGQIVIMDFGLAATGFRLEGAEARSGTPAYMAPEQLLGREASVQSDLYALGLVLYEIFTAKFAYADMSVAEMAQARGQGPPPSPSSIVGAIDPNVERAIMHCLQPDPLARPKSAAAVAAAFPGGDPLAAALAAGETPSPNLVAAAGPTQAIPMKAASAWLAAALVSLAIVGAVQLKTSLISKLPLDDPPQVLAAKGREIAQRFGYERKPADKAYGYDVSDMAMRFTATPGINRDLMLATAKPVPVVFFWYRESPLPLEKASAGPLSASDPPLGPEGSITMELSPNGMLTNYRAIPPASTEGPTSFPTGVLSVMGLDEQRFHPVPPRDVPSLPFDTRFAWDGSLAEFPSVTIHVEAASWRSRIVYVSTAGGWSGGSPVFKLGPLNMVKPAAVVAFLALMLAAVVGGAWWARSNLRKARGDTTGAFRFALAVFAARMGQSLLDAHHVPTTGEFLLLGEAACWSLLTGAALWTFYIAVEPYIRRRWPHCLISWARLLRRAGRDPLVGRDLTIGVSAGAIMTLCLHLRVYYGLRAGMPQNAFGLGIDELAGPLHFVSSLLGSWTGLAIGFEMALNLVFLVTICRRLWLGWALFMAIGILGILASPFPPVVGLTTDIVMDTVISLVIIRFGLLAVATASVAFSILVAHPFPADPSAWYAGSGLLSWALVALLAVYGFYTSLGGRPVAAPLGNA